MNTVFGFNTTPIRETILTISFSNNLEKEELTSFQRNAEKEKIFDRIEEGFHLNITHNPKANQVSADARRDGLVFMIGTPLETLLQAKRGLLSLHKLGKHVKFVDFLEEIDRYWKLLQDNTTDLLVTKVNLRYLNFIEVKSGEKISDLVTVYVKSPFSSIKSNFSQVKFTHEKDQNIEVTVVTSNGKDGDVEGIILDIMLQKQIEEKSFENISQAFEGMRELKNDLFQELTTENTKNKYR